jgi:hypothetical protein
MCADRVWSKLSQGVFLPAALALALTLGGGARAEEPMTTEEVVAELIELTPVVTPFTVAYDKATKTLIFNEEIESADKSQSGRIGELRARLDRMDAKRMNYEGGDPRMTLVIKGKPIGGVVRLHCRANAKCVSRGYKGPGASVTETDEEVFAIDIFADTVTFNQLRRFATLIQNLIIVSNPE